MANILIVDDDAQLRGRLAAYLTRCGHGVSIAEDGKRALSIVREASIEVVVTDINMPDMDGIEVILAVRDAAAKVPIIAMSGGGLFDKTLLLDSAGALGAVVTLDKPFEPEQLNRAIEAALEGQ
jgi:DNA-binding response OmpR family regulator